DARTFQSMYRLLDRVGLGGADQGGAQVAANVEAWLATRPANDRPAFTFVDLVGTQRMMATVGGAPPIPPDTVGQATSTHDGGGAHADGLLGRIVDALRRRGTLDRTILVVLSDHGELLGEHGEFGHGRSLYEPVLHVPLLIRDPGRIPAGRRVATPVSTAG